MGCMDILLLKKKENNSKEKYIRKKWKKIKEERNEGKRDWNEHGKEKAECTCNIDFRETLE